MVLTLFSCRVNACVAGLDAFVAMEGIGRVVLQAVAGVRTSLIATAYALDHTAWALHQRERLRHH